MRKEGKGVWCEGVAWMEGYGAGGGVGVVEENELMM